MNTSPLNKVPWLSARFERARAFLTRDVWAKDLAGLPTFRAVFYKVSRVLYLALRGFVEDRCFFRASALTYITVLSVVPLLAFAFSVAKGLGAYEVLMQETVEPFLDETFGPLPRATVPVGDTPSGLESESERGGVEVRRALDKLLEFVRETDMSSLGLFGLVILLYAVIKLLGSVEDSFNDIWGVTTPRNVFRKFADYLSMVVIVPIFLVTATGVVTALESTLRERHVIGPLLDIGLRFGSLIAMWLAFTFIYVFMPNTRTRITSAAIGGLIGGTLWLMAQVLHVRFQVGVANYNAIYSSFAAFPIFLVWVFTSWVTVLLGAEFAFAHQNEPAYRQLARSRHIDHGFREVLALRALGQIGATYLDARPPVRICDLAQALNVPERTVEEIAHLLQEGGIVSLVGELEPALLPARPLERVKIGDVLDALKGKTARPDFPPQNGGDLETDRVFDEFRRETDQSPCNRTLREVAEACAAGLARDQEQRESPNEARRVGPASGGAS